MLDVRAVIGNIQGFLGIIAIRQAHLFFFKLKVVYPIVFVLNIFPDSRLIQKHIHIWQLFERNKMITKQGEILRHIQEEFIIIFSEMIKIYKRHTSLPINFP